MVVRVYILYIYSFMEGTLKVGPLLVRVLNGIMTHINGLANG